MKSSIELGDMRREYESAPLTKSTIDPNPFVQFDGWLKEAIEADLPDAHAMGLSTVNSEGRPSSRILLLKEVQSDGFIFFTSYSARKSQDLEQNPFGAMLFYWSHFNRQIRIEGQIEKISADRSRTYFKKRPADSQIMANVSKQSREIPNRDALIEAFEAFEAEIKGKEIDCPEDWGGYILKPDYFEFWQGQVKRLHDRISYHPTNIGWETKRLAP
ncbi:MAG: pyridoxamine 5'-phosphate oxidase [Candidatus Marinamargulisbacteria bacterium]|jgi:pyridoxamine 5'-phosphate oxidase